MTGISATSRITLSLVSLTTSVVLLAATFGFFPNPRLETLKGRRNLCESIAINLSAMASKLDADSLRKNFEIIVGRNPEIISLVLRRASGERMLVIGDHSQWQLGINDESTDAQMLVPVFANDKIWGAVEIQFEPIDPPGIYGLIHQPEFALAGFVAILSLIVFYFYLRTVFKVLNPSKVVPGRVRDAFNSLAEGLVVLDQKQRIMLVNRSFEIAVGKGEPELLGRPLQEIQFVKRDVDKSIPFPWEETIAESETVIGRLIGIGENEKTFSVNSSPIIDEKGNNRGALASFEDVSQLERKNEELQDMVEHLHASSEKIKSQNRELEVLATRDPLTGCWNRRSFYEQFEAHFNAAIAYGTPLTAVMVDIDHFKSINDNHGHSTGDEVLSDVAAAIRDSARETDFVCRYGGEEFAALLPESDIDDGKMIAERFRHAVQDLKFVGLSVTASFGVSAISLGAKDPQELLDQADKCLYIAKRHGRNQVVRWDRVPDDIELDESPINRLKQLHDFDVSTTIPFQAVTALISALAYRDQETAAHSRRVADMAVRAAEGFLSIKDCYILEIAALLHDIGKIGVPDSILLKPGPLTAAEWKIMDAQDRIGIEIIHASFASPALSEIVEFHQARFDGANKNPRLPGGRDIPIGSRILAIADAYDAMVTDRVFRKAKPQKEAFEELRCCAGTQFDPELVERFIRAVQDHNQDEVHQRTGQISIETALNIGIQIERLVNVLDGQDTEELRNLSQRLIATANKFEVPDIAEKAADLDTTLQSDADIVTILQTATELLDLCRSTQTSILENVKRTALTVE